MPFPLVLPGVIEKSTPVNPSDQDRYLFFTTGARVPAGANIASPAGSNYRLSKFIYGTPQYAINKIRLHFSWFACTESGTSPAETVLPGNGGNLDEVWVSVGAGALTRVTFNGGSTAAVNMASGSIGIWSDEIVLGSNVPPESDFIVWTLTHVSAGSNHVPVKLTSTERGERVWAAGDLATLQALLGSSADSTAVITSSNYGCDMMAAKGWDGRPVILGLNDSIGDRANDSVADARGNRGIVKRWLDKADPTYGRIPHFFMGCNGASSDREFITGTSDKRWQVLAQLVTLNGGKLPFTHILDEHAQNNYGASVAISVSNSKGLLDRVLAVYPGVPVIGWGQVPKTNSTDGFRTLTNQAYQTGGEPGGGRWQYEAVREALLDGYYAGFIKIRDALGYDDNGLKWPEPFLITSLVADVTSGFTSCRLVAAPQVGDMLHFNTVTATTLAIVLTVTGSAGDYNVGLDRAVALTLSAGAEVYAPNSNDGSGTPRTGVHPRPPEIRRIADNLPQSRKQVFFLTPEEEVTMAKIVATSIGGSLVTDTTPVFNSELLVLHDEPKNKTVRLQYRALGSDTWIDGPNLDLSSTGTGTVELPTVLTDGPWQFRQVSDVITIYSDIVDVTVAKPDVVAVFSTLTERPELGFMLFVGQGAPNGTFVGKIAPKNIPKPVGTYSISGAGAAGLSINSSTGQITVTNSAAISAVAGDYSVTITYTNTQGVASITTVVTVIASSDTGYCFVDPVTGNDANSGYFPHTPRATTAPTWSKALLWPRGSTVVSFQRGRNNTILGSWGDSSLERAIIDAAGADFGITNAINSGSGQSISAANYIIRDLIIRNPRQTCVRIVGGTNLKLHRLQVESNSIESGLQGIYIATVTGLEIVQCRNGPGITGDIIYLTGVHTVLIDNIELTSAEGYGSDCLQITNERKAGRSIDDIWIRDSIIKANGVSSNKGALVLENHRDGEYLPTKILVENCEIHGKYFTASSVAEEAVFRNNRCFGARVGGNAWGIGNGAFYDAGRQHVYDNEIYDCLRGLVSTGFDDVSPGWQRPDILFNHNYIHGCDVVCRIDRPTSGYYKVNVSWNNLEPHAVVSGYAVSSVATGGAYTTLDLTGNYVNNSEGPKELTPAIVSGTPANNQVLTVTNPTVQGTAPFTYAYHWRENGKYQNPNGTTALLAATNSNTCTVPADFSTRLPSWLPAAARVAEISCVVVVTDALGNETLCVAKNSSGRKYLAVTG